MAGIAVRHVVRTAVDDPQDGDGLAGNELGRTQRTGPCAQRKLIRVPAARAIRAYPHSPYYYSVGDGHVGDWPTIETCCGGCAGVVRLFQCAIAAEPASAE